MKHESNPWTMLVEAIVARALIDYHQAKETLMKYGDNKKAKDMKEEVEDFFDSEIFALYADFNEAVIPMAQKEGFASDR